MNLLLFSVLIPNLGLGVVVTNGPPSEAPWSRE